MSGQHRRGYLKHIKVDSFGALSNRAVGPLAPGLNVVFGKNEAGKTTLASFVGGVLFGWEEARGSKNTYKPANAERAGSLFFAPRADCRPAAADASSGQPELGDPEEWEVSRAKNSEGLRGDAGIVADIDKETFRTMFSLTSDELRSLRNTTDVTAKLLTAGSGTGASPAQALADVQARLAEYTSRASGVEHSITRLAARCDDLREQLAAAADEAERLKRQDREFRELEPQRDDLLHRLDELNAGIEALSAQRFAVEKIDQQLDDLRSQRDSLRAEETALRVEQRARQRNIDGALASITAADERALRDQIEVFSEERAKCDHSVDLANENCAASTASYEALVEAEGGSDARRRARRQKRVQVGLSIALPLMFICVGVPVFIHGRQITSLSFTALGVGLVVFALILALAALAMLFRPDREAEAADARRQDAQWVMLQDKKKLEACVAMRERHAERVREVLDGAGLGAAQGSLRRARSLLDEARDARSELASLEQRRRAAASRLSALNDAADAARRQRQAIFESLGLRDEATMEALDAAAVRRARQRAALLEASENLNRRYGELKQVLAQARYAHRFDEIKMEYQQVRTRLDESAVDYARLLLAKRMLEGAIAAWESKSQPEVYRRASRLLSLMTEGRWVKVRMAPEGKLQVVDAVKTSADPVRLSLGTCQQLYLAMRIALLMEADSVGRSIPILADDILVNFDASRRIGAARALAELALMRQVVLFTCHEEVVDALREADPLLNEIVL